MVEAVRVEEQQNLSVAWIAARRGMTVPGMPADRQWAADNGVVAMAIGPGMWLAQQQEAPPGWCSDLEQRLAGLASVSDQTGAYRTFRIEGTGARTLMQRGVAIDLHDTAFPAGSVAGTAIAHIDVILRCLETDRAYEVAVYRSYAESFLRWLADAVRAI